MSLNAAEYIQHHLTHLRFNLTNFTFTDGGFWSINVDTMSVSLILGLIFIFTFRYVAKNMAVGVPGKLQNFIELLVEFVDKTVRESFHGRSSLIAPLAL